MGNNVAYRQPYPILIKHHSNNQDINANPVGGASFADDIDNNNNENHPQTITTVRTIDSIGNGNYQCQCQGSPSNILSSAYSSVVTESPMTCANCHNQPNSARHRICVDPKHRCSNAPNVIRIDDNNSFNNNNWVPERTSQSEQLQPQSQSQHSHSQQADYHNYLPTTTTPPSSPVLVPNNPNSIAPLVASFAQMLNAQLGDYLEMTKQGAIVTTTSSAFKCAGDNRNSDNTDSNNNKINYKNLFPKTSDEMEHLFGAVLSNQNESSQHLFGHQPQPQQQRRCSQLVAPPTDTLAGSCFAQPAQLGSSGSMDTIRINLPEILDHQDEITILRLLIKLLAGKVTKLSDEKRRLLQHITTLNDINEEMAAIIEYQLKRNPSDYPNCHF